MRRTLPVTLLAIIATIAISACSNSSNAAANSTDQNAATSSAASDNTATDNTATTGNAAATDNTAASMAPADAGAAAAAPVYPGAAMGPRPKGVADGAPPTVKAYLTPDGMATVRTWYKVHLKGASEMGAPNNDKTKDVFLVGQGATGQVVMLQSVGGKTWVIIGPPK
jgi:hypothetical protein